MERTQRLCEQVLQDVGMGWADLTGVLLVGGSTRMQMVHEYVSWMSGKKPMTGINVDEAVALGAAVLAAQKVNERSPGVPPYRLSGKRRTHDVTSHGLGMIAVSEDGKRYVNSVILPRNHPIPSTATRPYTLATDAGQPGELEVYMTQGDSSDPTTCSFLGKYRFSAVPPDKGGKATLDITYRYDASGVVQVTAQDRQTRKALPMTVEALPGDLSWLNRPPVVAGRSHLTVYLMFDLSGSMSGAPLREAQDAAREFVRQIDLTRSSLGLVCFADWVQTSVEACQDSRQLEQGVARMRIGMVGGGNDASPFAHTQRLLTSRQGSRFVVLLTDGVWSYPDRAIKEAQACASDNIEIIAIGFGGADREFLRKVATSDKGSILSRQGELVATFGGIAQELTETSAVSANARRGLRFF
jgi:Mg-chelatase subunit ChlD